MSQESLDHVVAGALFDFVAFLTTREDRLTLSAYDAAPLVTILEEFMELRGVDPEHPMTYWWPARCSNGKLAPSFGNEEEPDVVES